MISLFLFQHASATVPTTDILQPSNSETVGAFHPAAGYHLHLADVKL